MFLRQSTASQEVLLGPFVDSVDGNTAETGLTIANTDIQIFKEGATTLANKNSGGATHIANGYYSAVLDATDTNTVGQLEVHVKVAGALAISRRYQVVEEAVYDALFAASANFQGLADAVLSRNVSNVEATAGEHTLCTAVLAMLEHNLSGGTLTIYRTNGTTVHVTKTATTDPSAEPLTGIS